MVKSQRQLPVELVARRFGLGVTMAIVIACVLTLAAMLGGTTTSFLAIDVEGHGLSPRATALCALVIGALCVGFLAQLRAALNVSAGVTALALPYAHAC
jgi:hypothetical protein